MSASATARTQATAGMPATTVMPATARTSTTAGTPANVSWSVHCKKSGWRNY